MCVYLCVGMCRCQRSMTDVWQIRMMPTQQTNKKDGREEMLFCEFNGVFVLILLLSSIWFLY